MKRLVLILAVALISFGCANYKQTIIENLSKDASRFVGVHSDELLMKKGSPDLKERLPTGEELWTYSSTKGGPHKGWSVGAQNSSTWQENVNFVIGIEKVVKSYSISVE